jgi:DNA-binding CsgD family transcriptional regulator
VTVHIAATTRPKLVGRGKVREAMLSTVALARTEGGVILVLGEAGLGKTELLTDFAARLVDWTLLRLQADRHEADLSFSTVETLIRLLNSRLGSRMRMPQSDANPVTVGRALLGAIDRLEAPVCLIIDDAQWVDAASSRAIRFVLRRQAGQPFLMIAAARPRSSRDSMLFDDLATASPHFEQATLEPLTVANVQELATVILGHSISRRTATRLTQATHGSPLLLSALLEQVRESFAIALHPAGWDAPLPTNPRVSAAVAVTLDGATDQARRAAELVAVLRDPIPYPLLGSIAASLVTEIDAAAAIGLGLVHETERDGVTWVEPAHRMIADALGAELPLARRVEIHRAAATVLSGRRALRHRVEAAGHSDAALAKELLTASRESADLGEADVAMTYARSALHLAPAGDFHERCLLELGLLAMRTRLHERIFDLLGAIEALPQSPTRDAILVELRILTGNVPGALTLARSTLAATTNDGAAETRALRAHIAAAIPKIQMATRDFGPVIDQIAFARTLLEEAPSDPAEIAEPALKWMAQPNEELLWLIGWQLTAAAHLNRLDLIADAVTEVDNLALESPGSPALVDAFVTRSRAFILTGELTRARADLARANELMLAFPISWTASHGRAMFAHVLYLLGEWDDSLALADNAVALALDETDLSGWPLALTASTLVRAARGEEKVVRERLSAAADALPTIMGAYDADLPHIARAELARARGLPKLQLEAAAAGKAASAASSTMGWQTYRIDALASLGRTDEARIALQECTKPASRWQPYYGSIAWLEGRVNEADGKRDFALASYKRACNSPDSELYPLPLAVALVDLARVFVRAGQTTEAVGSLLRAASIFRRLGASDYLRRCTAELEKLADGGALAAAIAPPEDLFDRLTTRERQVAHALAAGMTNKEIAERLYVSVTTVNFHVRNILAKLGLSSRRDLRRITSTPRGHRTSPPRHDDRPSDHSPVKN